MRIPNYIENFDKWKEEFNFSIDIKIRFSETDMFGHVNNVSPFIYFEEARIAYLESIQKGSHEENDSIPIVADLQCDYFNQIYFGNTLKLFVKVDSVGKSSLDIHYMALNEKGTLCLTGRGTMVNFNPLTNKSVPINDEMKLKLLETKSS